MAVVDQHRVISAGVDGTLLVWDLGGERILHELKGPAGWINAIAVAGGCRAVFSSDNGLLRVWDFEAGSLQTLRGHSDWVRAVAVVDDDRAISAFDDRTLRIWSLGSLERLEKEGFYRIFQGNDWVRSMAVDGHRIIAATAESILRVWGLESGQILQTLRGHKGEVRAVALVKDHHAVSASDDRTLRLWDLESGKTLAVMMLGVCRETLQRCPDVVK